jgi:outer membrane protein assembly factor BamB
VTTNTGGRARRRVSGIAVAALAACAAGVPAASSRADDWPGFRGADGRAVSTEKGLPAEWDVDQNVRWRVKLPGPSNGSPAVWGDRVFILQAADGNRRTVMCFARADGKLLWQEGVTYDQPEQTHPANPPCSGTPATDGERVVAAFGSAGLACFDMDGKELWRRDLGKLNHIFGNAISPVIVGDRVVMNFGPGEGTRLVAVDKHTGEVAWEAKPPKVDPSEQTMGGARMAGPAMMIAPTMAGAGDADKDGAVSREEMAKLADAWFDQLDPDKAGKLAPAAFAARLDKVLASPMIPPGFSPGKALGPVLFRTADADKDAALTRDEWKATFDGWFDAWGGGKGEPIDANQMIDGFVAIFPAPPPRGGGGFGGETGPGGSWSTPVVIDVDGRKEVVVGFPNRLVAYDPATGKELWFSKGLADQVNQTPMYDDGVVYCASSDMAGGTVIAVKPGGSGDVTESHRAWRQTRVKGAIGTGVAHAGHLYWITSDGFALCLDAKTGKRVYQKRLDAGGGSGESWSSMILADGKLYAPNKSGDVFVIRASPKFELLATNSLDEPTNATLAASDGDLFLRSDASLWCIGEQKK